MILDGGISLEINYSPLSLSRDLSPGMVGGGVLKVG